MSSLTEISITIDTEFSIAGALIEGKNFQPVSEKAVLCEVAGKEQGLGFLLETFDKHNVSASFFVETANYYYFGDDPMRSYVRRIQAAGQDVQLHVHPVWLNFNSDPDIGYFSTNDNCSDRDDEELKRIFELCIDVFERWAGKRPEAIRTGNLVADRTIYRVMNKLGIPLSSNIAMGVCQPQEEGLELYCGEYIIEGVREFPVFSYEDLNLMGRKHMKSLQITSCSWPEMKHILWKARRSGIKNIVILTHPFEYIKTADFRYEKIIRNRVNQKRLEKLCQFISKYDQDFATIDFHGLSRRPTTQKSTNNPLMRIPSYYAVGRKIHNKINDSIWYY